MADSVQVKATSGATKPRPPRTHPTLHKMVLEALGANKSVKGLTLQGIKKYIIETYPETKENFSNLRLRTAMKKGQENNEIIRPKSSENEGFTGHFLLNRALIAQNQKEQKKKTSKLAKEGRTIKSPKRVAKSPKKVAKAAKSPKTKKSVTNVKTPVKAASKIKKTAVKKPKSTVKTPKANKAESAGAVAKSAFVKKRTKTVTKSGAKAKK